MVHAESCMIEMEYFPLCDGSIDESYLGNFFVVAHSLQAKFVCFTVTIRISTINDIFGWAKPGQGIGWRRMLRARAREFSAGSIRASDRSCGLLSKRLDRINAVILIRILLIDLNHAEWIRAENEICWIGYDARQCAMCMFFDVCAICSDNCSIFPQSWLHRNALLSMKSF